MLRSKNNLDTAERLLLYFGYLYMPRLGELANLQVKDLDLEAREVAILKSKNKSTRILDDLPAQMIKDLRLMMEGKGVSDLVFGMEKRTMFKAVDRIFEKTGVKKRPRGYHAFRHGGIMRAVLDPNEALPIPVVAEIVGNTAATIENNNIKRIPSQMVRSAQKKINRLRLSNRL